MKKSKKIIIAVLCVLLAVILAGVGTVFCYYPHYLINKKSVSVSDNSQPGEIRVMSSNLRCFSLDDLGKKSWFYRADLIIKNIEKETPDIIGFQECTKLHYSYLCDRLEGYDSILTYRDDSAFSEACPIFYRSSKYELIDKNSFWLSETPEEMSIDWGSACYRICSYVILKEKESEKQFVVFNTHLDHVSDEARIKGIGVILEKIDQFGSLPSMIMGDFNAEEDSETYKSVTENFLDVKYQTKNTMTSCTYQNYGQELNRNCIDYLVISKKGFTVNSYKVVTDTYDGVYPSDHFPLSVSLTLS
ncbi:MAG: endonuclease/exonuclease/phosphatase family protein [Acutalibacteraceae bacterium]